jgi:hypothetical protein
MNNYYIKCLKCGHKCETMSQFDTEFKEDKWFIGGDGWTWDYEHDCSTKELV